MFAAWCVRFAFVSSGAFPGLSGFLADLAALLAVELHVSRIFFTLAFCGPKGTILVFVSTTFTSSAALLTELHHVSLLCTTITVVSEICAVVILVLTCWWPYSTHGAAFPAFNQHVLGILQTISFSCKGRAFLVLVLTLRNISSTHITAVFTVNQRVSRIFFALSSVSPVWAVLVPVFTHRKRWFFLARVAGHATVHSHPCRVFCASAS